LGRVIKVNKYAEPGNFWGSSAKEYAVIVQIIDPPQEIRTGMTSEVRIFVEQIQDAVQLPFHAVYELKKHHFVLVKKGLGWETREISLGASNEKFVTIKTGVEKNEQVVLDPRNHLNKMKLPDIQEVSDRETLAKIQSESPKIVDSKVPTGDGPAGSGAPGFGAARGGPGGPPGGVAGGGFNPDTIAKAILDRLDTNTDGKLSKEEVAEDERMKSAFADYDSNQDGSIDRSEMAASLRKRMAAGGGGGGGGPARGAPSN